MTDKANLAGKTGPSSSFFSKFSGFDELIGNSLIKVIYFIGLAAIAISAVLAIIRSFAMMSYSGGAGFMMLLLAVVGSVVGVIFWRFICELYILAYLFYDRVGEIRDRLPPK